MDVTFVCIKTVHPNELLGVGTFWGVHLLILKEIWHVFSQLPLSTGKQFVNLFYVIAS